MAFNPYSGGVSTPQPQIGGQGGGGNQLLQQLKQQMQGKPQAVARKGPQGTPGRPKGTKRRTGGGGKSSQGGPMPQPSVPLQAPMPEVPMTPESPPLGVNHALARQLGNGGYRNGGF
tara:strand:+ start:12674 stop:13024 length:351 start_codon:yes stop_codon:yes gene_type:complete